MKSPLNIILPLRMRKQLDSACVELDIKISPSVRHSIRKYIEKPWRIDQSADRRCLNDDQGRLQILLDDRLHAAFKTATDAAETTCSAVVRSIISQIIKKAAKAVK